MKKLTKHFHVAHEDSEDEAERTSISTPLQSSKKSSSKKNYKTIQVPSKSISSGVKNTNQVASEAAAVAIDESKKNLADQIKAEVQRKIHQNMKESTTARQPKKVVKISTSETPKVESLKKTVKPVEHLRLTFYEDKESERIRDVGGACLPFSSQEPFLNSFIAFFHQKRGLSPASVETETVPTLTYRNDLSSQDDEEEEEEKDSVKQEVSADEEGDPLLQHIEASGLPLKPRRATLMDGNCWYDAAADQVLLHQIPDRPGDHHQLRLEVCRSLRNLPQTSSWVENLFSNSKKKFSKFIARHRRPGTWTDNLGIMCQATALYLGKVSHRHKYDYH